MFSDIVGKLRGTRFTRLHGLQLAACAVLAFAWFRSDSPASAPPSSATADAGAIAQADTGASAVVAATVEPQPQERTAALGWSSIEVVVDRNDTLDRIFRRLQLDLADLASLRALPDLRKTFDRLRPGEALTFFHRGSELMGLERQLTESERLSIERQESGFFATLIPTPVDIETLTSGAVIDSSLFEAARDAGISDQSALAIADIFAWDIDFVLDVQKGDAFTVTYEKVSKNGSYLRDGNILAVKFVNNGREYRAVRYVGPDDEARYYTPEGRSLKKAFLRAPLEFSRVSSRFNLSRRHPVLNRIRAHKGVDYAAPTGTPVRAAGDGKVHFRGVKGGYGNVLELRHAGGVVTVYGHLSRFAKGLRTGQSVSQGQVVAYVGKTGLATGPHLHYEYRLNGVHKDPQKVKLPIAEPIAPELLADFTLKTAPLLAALEPQGAANSAATLAAR